MLPILTTINEAFAQ